VDLAKTHQTFAPADIQALLAFISAPKPGVTCFAGRRKTSRRKTQEKKVLGHWLLQARRVWARQGRHALPFLG
jgi:hypothetical protein